MGPKPANRGLVRFPAEIDIRAGLRRCAKGLSEIVAPAAVRSTLLDATPASTPEHHVRNWPLA